MPLPTNSFDLAVPLANALNPLLALTTVAAPLIERRVAPWLAGGARSAARKPVAYGWYLVRSGVGLVVAVGIAEWGKRHVVWPGHPYFPSGHETFAAATVAALGLRHRRWLAFGLPVALLMAWALVRAGYHDVPDVCGGFMLGVAAMGGITTAFDKAHPRATLPDT